MTFAGRDWRANEASVTLCSRDGRIGEGGRLAVNGLEGMQPTRRVRWRALRAATRSKFISGFPVDHNRHQILVLVEML
jgi:hypothetical protein